MKNSQNNQTQNNQSEHIQLRNNITARDRNVKKIIKEQVSKSSQKK